MHDDWVRSVAYSPDGTHIVSGCDDKSVRIRNIDSGQVVKRFSGLCLYVQHLFEP